MTMLYAQEAYSASTQWENLRTQAIERKRKVIYNTDGGDAMKYPATWKVSPEKFISRRLIYTVGSRIDSVFYCPTSSGFGYLTCKTSAGDQLLKNIPMRANVKNITGDLLKTGTDPVRLALEHCHKNGLEFFVSLRVNDIHDSYGSREKPHFLFPPFKQQHPEVLMGSPEQKPPFCKWSAVDFTHELVRDRMAAIVEELCVNYDLDGIEYDFMRHMQLFKSVAWGAQASVSELNIMSNFMKRLRKITENAGKKRGRPVLVAIRIPDSAEYCRAVGIDLGNWLQNKYVDMVIGSSYFHLKPWNDSVKLCRKYRIKFYASLDESRIKTRLPSISRNGISAYHARAASALRAGVNGIYYFNLEGEDGLQNIMRGNLDDLKTSDKIYFITYRGSGGDRPDKYLRNGLAFYKLPVLEPGAKIPQWLCMGESLKLPFEFGDDFRDPSVLAAAPEIVVGLQLEVACGQQSIDVAINGKTLECFSKADSIMMFHAKPEFFIPGMNNVTIKLGDQPQQPIRKIKIIDLYIKVTFKNKPLNSTGKAIIQQH